MVKFAGFACQGGFSESSSIMDETRGAVHPEPIPKLRGLREE